MKFYVFSLLTLLKILKNMYFSYYYWRNRIDTELVPKILSVHLIAEIKINVTQKLFLIFLK